jgi:hypothetical protein
MENTFINLPDYGSSSNFDGLSSRCGHESKVIHGLDKSETMPYDESISGLETYSGAKNTLHGCETFRNNKTSVDENNTSFVGEIKQNTGGLPASVRKTFSNSGY